MDPLLEQWQKDYKNATPKLDTAALLSQITSARKKQSINQSMVRLSRRHIC